jgi:hypothetical protein
MKCQLTGGGGNPAFIALMVREELCELSDGLRSMRTVSTTAFALVVPVLVPTRADSEPMVGLAHRAWEGGGPERS